MKSFVRLIVVLLAVLTGVSAQEMAFQGKWKTIKERSSDLDYFQYATMQFALSTSEIDRFLSFFTNSSSKSETLQAIESNWKPEYEVLLIEVAYLLRDPISAEIIRTLEKKTNQDFGHNFNSWYAWLWNKEQNILPDYDYFKARLYRPIDPQFEKYFLDRGHTSSIRLDEIRWGGVKQDGIPSLRSPHMLEADEAGYLDDDDVVFGMEINGDVRAYPKRILAWHEMFADTVGGIPVAGVYCTLCGTVIVYKTLHNGIDHQLGTSGFLYRSNKLMYDKATQSLWSTMEGIPVVGPLAGKGIELEYFSVVTTTWSEWKRRHPETKVLDIETGFVRDYDEGAAYHDYFSTDELMFNTIPERFALDQNYPNPFNPTTVIRYALPVDARVTLEVYDMLGRRIAELVNGQIEARYHDVSFDASHLSSGLYLYRLQSNAGDGKNFMQVRKLMVLK